MNYIYTLTCPLTNEIKYVGKTSNPKSREQNHNSSYMDLKNFDKYYWVMHLKTKGLKPVFEIIEEIDGEGDFEEQYWIAQCKAWGFELFNKTIGGKGFNGKHTVETRKLLQDIVNNLRKNGFDPRKGKTHTEATKDKLRNAFKGCKYSKQVRYNMALGKSEGIYKIYKDDIFLGDFISTPDVQKKLGFPGRSIYDLAKNGKVGVSRKMKGVRVEFYPKKQ